MYRSVRTCLLIRDPTVWNCDCCRVLNQTSRAPVLLSLSAGERLPFQRGRLCYCVSFPSSTFVVCHLQEMEHSVQELKSMESIQLEPRLSNERTELTFMAVFVRSFIGLNFCSTRTDPASCAVSFQSKISLWITDEIRCDMEDFSVWEKVC